ncbi:hypothetical protein PPL_00769 [Heterostelium album PN500]|uniref:Uncharacterized protein n=1 Tax=Heterostelium pallidum (strain ATCC 26659 / Pp 5 / PN500) TaxID=670386 RepID=D3AXD8_HETP5|nr:hypothetical protein PPL_00769 [Heterostelium album PN500]EFA86207.1 hypothetical protein PPL_00769 [Heterostelium album PN500]|eukprot:XP_020438312.1 hypothetical protein PPL_00769 [Heterostelium album PN500]
MTPPTSPFNMKVLTDTLQVNSFIDNIVSGTFDVNVKIHEWFRSEEFPLSVLLKIDQFTKSEIIFNHSLKFDNGQMQKIIVPFTAPVNDDTVIRVRISRYSSYCEQDMGLYIKHDGQPQLETDYDRMKRLEPLGGSIYRYSDKNVYYGHWTAINSYSVENLTRFYFGHGSSSSTRDDGSKLYGFNSSGVHLNLEHFADIVCHHALRLQSDYIILYYTDQNGGSDHKLTVLANDTDDFDTHKLIDLIQLGYKHWIDLECNYETKTTIMKKIKTSYILNTTRFSVNTPHSYENRS